MTMKTHRRAGATEARLFRAMNKILEPSVRHGFGSAPFTPGTLIVLEIVGRTSGRRTKVPLAALHVGEHILVATFRGRRSEWVKNLAAMSEVRFWLGGRARRATVRVLKPDRTPRRTKDLSPAARALVPFLAPYTHAGWAFAILTPQRSAKRSDG